MLAGAGLKIVGGLTNAAFGYKIDKERLNSINQGIADSRNFMSNASSFDDIKGPASFMTNTKDVYQGGWFTSGAEKNEELARQVSDAVSWMDRSIGNNIANISKNQLGNALASYSAFGGPITRRKRKKI
jgi:hypothetical protein